MNIYRSQRCDIDVERETRKGRAAPHMKRGADLELALNVIQTTVHTRFGSCRYHDHYLQRVLVSVSYDQPV